MSQEEKIQQELLNKFPFLENTVRIQRARRIFAEVPYEKFGEVFDFAVKELAFCVLCALTGLDEGATFGFVYHVSDVSGIVLNIKTSLPRENPVLTSITPYFASADIYERELVDLFGIHVEGLREDKRYPLPDDWPQGQYPLRKDWKLEMLKQKETT